MTERSPERQAPETRGFDLDLSLKAIVWTGVGLAALLVVTAVLVWPLSSALRGVAEKLDAPPPALPEALRQQPPDGPRLQTDPEAELAAMRADENAALAGYAWVDEAAGIARIPIERALEIVAERGLEAGRAAPGGAAAPDAAGGDGDESPATAEGAAP